MRSANASNPTTTELVAARTAGVGLNVGEPLGIDSGVGRHRKVDTGIGGPVVVRKTVRSIGLMVGIAVVGGIVRLVVVVVDHSKLRRMKRLGAMDNSIFLETWSQSIDLHGAGTSLS